MSTGYVLQSTKKPGLVFEILAFDPATKVATLRGETNVEFTETIDKEFLKQFNYRVMKKEDGDAQPTGV